jgi:hypothetical protein
MNPSIVLSVRRNYAVQNNNQLEEYGCAMMRAKGGGSLDPDGDGHYGNVKQ